MKELFAWVIGIPVFLLILFLGQAGMIIYVIYNGVDWLCENILKEWNRQAYVQVFSFLFIGAAIITLVWLGLNEAAIEISLFFDSHHFQLGGYIICLFALIALTISKHIKIKEREQYTSEAITK